MNIVKYFDELIKLYNNEQMCDMCWEFVCAGREDLFNQHQLKEESKCCVHVGITNISYGTKYIQDDFTHKDYCYTSFRLFVGIPSTLDIQFYNELDTSKTDSSKWEILNKIKECLGCDFMQTICDINVYAEPVQFDANMKLNYLDSNFDGWLIDCRLKY